MTKETPEEKQQLDEALASARAAFADKTEDEIMDEVVEIIHQMRLARRANAPASKPA